MYTELIYQYIDGLMPKRRNSSALAMVLRLFCIKPSIYDKYIIISVPGIIFCMCPANERRRYNVTSSLIGWAHSQNDPWYPML